MSACGCANELVASLTPWSPGKNASPLFRGKLLLHVLLKETLGGGLCSSDLHSDLFPSISES